MELDDALDDKLIELLDVAPILYKIGGTTIVRLSQTLVLKGGDNVLYSEAETLRFIAINLPDLRVPRVHRAFKVPDEATYFGARAYIVMDYIDGINLGDCWKQLDTERRKDVVNQTAHIICRLQSIELPTSGPLDNNTSPCRGHFFTDYSAGPFNSTLEMEAWFNHKLEVSQGVNQAPKDIPPFHFSKFVLVHQDISPRNIVLDTSGYVWLLDWAYSGAYPPAFEAGALHAQIRFSEFNKMLLKCFDWDKEEVRQLNGIGYALTNAAFA